ncbi:hypothetical protein BU24DRAFT_27562 [Aaosphaeria arxii CBS 175.79]|uniref:Uncharacterized protein n=1 Tax=Aaosphaeria arxii CBS 175.79 TaxID=1450172 RepID=A0A6A5YAF6_9PLEO|nr:uncharacterized protein BU24DRAFT_27562 [Aaosphaeria arxii CBS 175.79]KAF2021741.1 hypothetical protein BU24DRAFT_27562 [Aaosphaeria arxii CBS 175.79]
MGIGLNLMISYSQVARTGFMITAKVLFSLVSDLYLDEPVNVTRGDSLTSSPDSEQGSYHLIVFTNSNLIMFSIYFQHISFVCNGLCSCLILAFSLGGAHYGVWLCCTRFIKQRFLPCLDAPISLRLIRHPDI